MACRRHLAAVLALCLLAAAFALPAVRRRRDDVDNELGDSKVPSTNKYEVAETSTNEDTVAETSTNAHKAAETSTNEDKADETSTKEDTVAEASTNEDKAAETSTNGDKAEETSTNEDKAAETSTDKDKAAETSTYEDKAVETFTNEDNVAETSNNGYESSLSTTTPVSLVANNDFDDDDDSFEEDDDEDFSESMQSSPTTGGSNLFSLIRLAGALFPGSSASNPFLWNMAREILAYNQGYTLLRRQDVGENVIEIDYVKGLKPPPSPFRRQEIEDDSKQESSESEENSSSGSEESVEKENKNGDDGSKEGVEKEDSGDDDDQDADNDDYDEPPEGDGQGGGVLGILAGLSGGEDGQSDLGDLLATVSGIVGSLSGDGIDLNALIASGLGLFVGLLSEGDENPGAVIASYLLTSLESITGGGAENNGAFFGNLVSKLVKGTSAAGESDGDSDENGGNGNKMADSAGFFISLLMSLLGDMSKSSSGGSSHPWRRHEQTEQLIRMALENHK